MSLPCGCELDGKRRLWQLFGITFIDRARSCSPTASLAPRGTRSPLRRRDRFDFLTGPDAPLNFTFSLFGKIQGLRNGL